MTIDPSFTQLGTRNSPLHYSSPAAPSYLQQVQYFSPLRRLLSVIADRSARETKQMFQI
jgi:hypothetical protein